MIESTLNDKRPQLEMRWLPVTDPDGRTRMVASWLAMDAVHASAASHAA